MVIGWDYFGLDLDSFRKGFRSNFGCCKKLQQLAVVDKKEGKFRIRAKV